MLACRSSGSIALGIWYRLLLLILILGVYLFLYSVRNENIQNRQGNTLRALLCLPASRGFHNVDELTGFLTCFPFFDVFPSVLKPKVTCCQKVDETHSSGSCTGFTPVSLTDFAWQNPHQIIKAKIQKNSTWRCAYFFRNLTSDMTKKCTFAKINMSN